MNSKKIDRRKSPDKWIYLSRTLALTSWSLFIFALIVSFYAAPDENYGLLRYHGIENRETWLMPLTNYLYIVLWFSAMSSYFCLLLDKYRARRKEDSKHFNLVMLLIIVIAWVTYILMSMS